MQDYRPLCHAATRICRLLLLSTILPLLASCAEDFDMETRVNTDGTCSRQISFGADSATFVGGGYMARSVDKHTRDICAAALIDNEIWTDNAWEKTWTEQQTGTHHSLPMTSEEYTRLRGEAIANHQLLEDTVRFSLSRNFPSVEDMSAALPFTVFGQPLEAQSRLQKKFRWFYTEYTFTETIRCIGDRYPVSCREYLTEEEMLCWYTNDATNYKGHTGRENLQMLERIEEKVDQWYSALFYHEALGAIAQNYCEVEGAPLALEQFQQMQDSLTADAVRLGFNVGKLSTKTGDYKLVANFLTHQLQNDAYAKALTRSTVLTEALDHVGESLLDVLLLNIHHRITLIDKAQDFEIKGLELIAHDHMTTVTTRQENLWAYIATLLICCIAVGSFAINKKKIK